MDMYSYQIKTCRLYIKKISQVPFLCHCRNITIRKIRGSSYIQFPVIKPESCYFFITLNLNVPKSKIRCSAAQYVFSPA
ncbi:MAG: hypothetical protein ACLUI0_10225 [Blautia massiliensis (ex Durand et al. 2017)]|uniref:hypothetical protein n=1 Tax=Blautia massiliensis (ex Durand et al. 2017) TaxID=1737424 RepID=UPI00399592CE